MYITLVYIVLVIKSEAIMGLVCGNVVSPPSWVCFHNLNMVPPGPASLHGLCHPEIYILRKKAQESFSLIQIGHEYGKWNLDQGPLD